VAGDAGGAAVVSPHRRDAAAAGRYAAAFIHGRERWARGCSVDVIYVLARWAAHWARRVRDE